MKWRIIASLLIAAFPIALSGASETLSTPILYDSAGADITLMIRPETFVPPLSLVDQAKKLLMSAYFSPLVAPLSVVFDNERVTPRGQMKDHTIYLSMSVTGASESLKVLTHESAHFIDIYTLDESVFGDSSNVFYNASWLTADTKKRGQKTSDFVSWYAMSNKYEDFAESVTMYVYHNSTFAKRALKSKTLQKKYDFFARFVFLEGAFQGQAFEEKILPNYSWDTTKIAVNTKNFLKYLN